MTRHIICLAIAASITLAGPARAGIENAGTTAANFLSVGSGASVFGMGGAAIGGGNDLNAAAWNVAALSWVGPTQVALGHSSFGDEQSQEWLGVGGRFGTSSTSWSVSGLYHGQGGFEGRDASGNPTGDFSVSSSAFGAALAQRFGDAVSVGIGAKYVREDLGTVQGGGLTFDGGVQVRAGRVSVGAAVQNVTGNMKYEGISYEFPTNYGAGVSLDVPEYGLRLALDGNAPYAYYPDLRAGVEWRWHDQFALRTGYRSEVGAEDGEPLNGPTFGMGAGVGGFWFDYGYVLSGADGGGQHQLGITVRPQALMSGAFGASSGGSSPSEPVVPDREPEPAAKKAPPEKKAQPQKKAETPKPKAEEKKQPAPKKDPAVKAEPEVGEVTTVVRTTEKAPARDDDAQDLLTTKRPAKHKVKAGETLYSIAKKYGTTVPKIMERNNMVNTTIHVGQVLELPKD